MFLCQTIHTALILEIGVILTPIGLAKLEQEFDTCIIVYSIIRAFRNVCFCTRQERHEVRQ